MKTLIISIRKFFVLLGNLLFGKDKITRINGSVFPADAVKKVWAINDDEALCVTPDAGRFSIAVKAGKWKLHIEAMNHYKYTVIENICVDKGRSQDAGIIRLARAS